MRRRFDVAQFVRDYLKENPSEDSRRITAQYTLRGTGLVERVCEHGVGHPDREKTIHWQDWMSVHGCDGCCGKPDFYTPKENP